MQVPNESDHSHENEPDDAHIFRPQGIPTWKLDDLITLEEAAKALPGRRHPSTVYRWADQGLRGVYLTCVSVGHQRYTTLDWLRNFLVASEAARTRRTEDDSDIPFIPQRHQRRSKQPRAHADDSDKQTRDTLRRHGLDSDCEPEDLN